MRRVVITGMGAVTPVGNDVESFWNSLVNGKNGIGRVTKFDVTDFKATMAAEVKDFDPLVYLEKNEVRKNDMFTVYALSAAQQAMTDSKLEMDPERLGVYFGSGIGGFSTFENEHTVLMEKGAKRVSPMFVPKMISNIAAGNIAIKFNAQGPCVSPTTACATGTTAIGEAYRAIKHGYCDAAITGGTEASISPLAFAGFINCMALSKVDDPNAASVPFDKRRAGFVMGEGAGALVVEEYEHAVARGAKIYAEICGYGSTCDAHHVTAPDPEGKGGARAIAQAIEDAEITDPSTVYINAHGTGTPLNDKTETLAIKKVFGDDAYKVHISSTKSMTGHMLGAAGAVEAIASAMALGNQIIPPTINYVEPDEECDLDYTPNTAKETKLETALSVSLGFGGHNACIALRRI